MPRLSARFGWQAGFWFGADDGARLAQVASSLRIVAAAEGRAVRRWGAEWEAWRRGVWVKGQKELVEG